MKGNKAAEKLAEAMSKLAQALEKFQDPVLWQKVISDAMRIGFLPPGVPAPPQIPGLPQIPGVVVGRVEAVSVSLTEEERGRMAEHVFQGLQPQLAEFNRFVQQALTDMPAARLRALAEKVEAGVKPTISRRQGCVLVQVGDEEYYLGL